jgi:hypothetical protein
MMLYCGCHLSYLHHNADAQASHNQAHRMIPEVLAGCQPFAYELAVFTNYFSDYVESYKLTIFLHLSCFSACLLHADVHVMYCNSNLNFNIVS